jgi:DNA topoisomerase-2
MNSLNAPPPAHLLCTPSKDYVGVMPFRGKGLNVTNASITKIAGNPEVQALIRILGLKTTVDHRVPEHRRSLRYGKFLMIGDADLDGFHIVSLLYNFFATLYPTLLQNTQDPFFFFLRTPIITLRPANARSAERELHLYSWLHAHAYLDQLYEDPASHSRYKVVYRKGLGVWNEREPKVEVGRRPVHLFWLKPAVLPMFNGEQLPAEQKVVESPTESKTESTTTEEVDRQMIVAREFLTHVFHKDNAAFRRKWLDDYVKTRRAMARTRVSEIDPNNTTPDYEVSQQSVRDFLSQELILFNEASCGRNLPRRDDGLKQSQRKIVHSAIVKPLPYSMADPLKVSQFSGYVAESTQYHYGDAALNDAIVRLAQSFVGSNNIPLLFPEGNFGSRHKMGKDAASPRYILTKQHIMTRMLFREEDDAYLVNEWDDGHQVEKREYMPILPMLLVNGASGVATGWSTRVAPHNPQEGSG